jgi:hypothetical protein
VSVKSAANIINEDRVIYVLIANVSIAVISSKHESNNNCQTRLFRFGSSPTGAVFYSSHYSIKILFTILGVYDFSF